MNKDGWKRRVQSEGFSRRFSINYFSCEAHYSRELQIKKLTMRWKVFLHKNFRFILMLFARNAPENAMQSSGFVFMRTGCHKDLLDRGKASSVHIQTTLGGTWCSQTSARILSTCKLLRMVEPNPCDVRTAARASSFHRMGKLRIFYRKLYGRMMRMVAPI